MANDVEAILRRYPRPYLMDGELKVLLDGTPDSRYGKVKRLLAQGKLLHLRRGLYGLTDELGYDKKIQVFELAQPMYGPSYISLESALSFHQLIPERVYTTTCATTKRSKEFHTPLGVFSYLHLPADNFYCEVDLITDNNSSFLMARPWKAICDYVYGYKKNWKSLKPLKESLRIDLEALPHLSDEKIELLKEYYHHKRINTFLHGIQKELMNKNVESS